jgi:hypothetical protein
MASIANRYEASVLLEDDQATHLDTFAKRSPRRYVRQIECSVRHETRYPADLRVVLLEYERLIAVHFRVVEPTMARRVGEEVDFPGTVSVADLADDEICG